MADNNIKEQPETWKAWVMEIIREDLEPPKEQTPDTADLPTCGMSIALPPSLAKLCGLVPYDNLAEWFQANSEKFDPEVPALTEAEWRQAEMDAQKRQQKNLLEHLGLAADRTLKEYVGLRRMLVEEPMELAKLNERELARKRSLLVWWNLEGQHKFGRKG